MKIDRNRWQELASEYVEGTLPDDQAEAVRAHLREEAQSRAEEAQLRGIMQGLSTLPEVDPPPYFADNVMAALHRQQAQRQPWWLALSPLGRTALGALTVGGAAAAIVWGLWMPRIGTNTDTSRAGIVVGNRPSAAPNALTGAPKLTIERSLRVVPDAEPMWEFAFTLENAERGGARCTLPGDPEVYRLSPLTRGVAQTLRVPVSAARGREVLTLQIAWNADGKAHQKLLLVPVAQDDQRVRERQSFGLGELPLTEAAREIADRFGVPITLEDVPADLRIAIVARDETAAETLERNLSSRSLQVQSGRGGIVIVAENTAPAH